ncbi:MAG: hypothetical protein JWN48_1501 [Myxococcaceae bacterium]|nr:hypothetical protein [Myxococcaceae bacterium]
MVERIILFKLHEPATRSEVAALTLAALADLPEVDELSVGLPADVSSEKSWDLSIVIRVANLALLGNLLDSAPFKDYLERTMQGRYVVVKAWSFERQG